MTTGNVQVEIYTIGHSNRSSDEFINLLKKYKIEMLIDVRSYPYSRFAPQFNRETISKTLANYKIAYQYLGDCLGGRPRDPTCYKDGTLPKEKANYLELVDYQEVEKRDFYREGVRQLMQIAAKHRTVILCSEEDPNRCHRKKLIAHTLKKSYTAINHIRGTGAIEIEMRETAEKHKLVQCKLLDFEAAL